MTCLRQMLSYATFLIAMERCMDVLLIIKNCGVTQVCFVLLCVHLENAGWDNQQPQSSPQVQIISLCFSLLGASRSAAF